MKLYIKNMVCNRCKMVVKSELEKFGLHPITVELGEVEIIEELDKNQKEQLNAELQLLGFDIIEDKKSRLIEKIKIAVVEMVHYADTKQKTNFSVYISEQLMQDYNYLSSRFSEEEGITIEQYIIAQKIERVKELLVYNELTLSEIAFHLNYSSVSHLSKQFKKVTGQTPSQFKELKEKKRMPIEEL